MAYAAVGMQSALDSAIGLPSRSTSASWMLGLVMPTEVRRSLMTREEISNLTGIHDIIRARASPRLCGRSFFVARIPLSRRCCLTG